jgi:hypothetical protein
VVVPVEDTGFLAGEASAVLEPDAALGAAVTLPAALPDPLVAADVEPLVAAPDAVPPGPEMTA